MTQAARKPSPASPENFHVLPKDEAAKEQAKKPASTEATGHIESRDADADALVGNASSEQLNQTPNAPARDRSQVD